MPSIYYIGIFLVCFSVLITSIAVPVLLLVGNRLKKQLENDYGKVNRRNRNGNYDTQR